jgi:hypothetical protein
MKTLRSGITVDADKYYKLLEWKDSNIAVFGFWCAALGVNMSINDLSLENYNALLQFADLDNQ